MIVAHPPHKALVGLAFSTADLTLAGAWADAHGLRIVVQLDHGTDDEEYEEVLAFYPAGSPLCRWLLWRTSDAVFVQPLIGRTRCYDSVAEAVESLPPRRKVVLTDIKATRWPS